MKSFAKILMTIIALLAVNMVCAQKIEILIVGSSHENHPGEEDYEAVTGKLKNFNPDMVFGEFLSPADYEALVPGSWAYDRMKKAKALVARSYPKKINSLDKKIASANKSLAKFAYLHKLRTDLASYYVMQSDRANAEYQFYILEHYMKKAFGKEEMEYYSDRFGNLDTLKKAGLYRPLSEYTNIYFPLLYALKHDKIYAMDCQKYDIAWSKAWGQADSAFGTLAKKAKADSTSAEAKTYAAIIKYSSLTEEDKKAMTKSSYYNMASDRYAELNDAWNFYGGKIFYGYAGFPDQHVKDMFIQWGNRNEGMCANLLRQAKEKKAKRVLVAVGAGHRRLMEEILARDPDVKIVSYMELI